MAGILTVDTLTHNKICVTWELVTSNFSGIVNNGNVLTSPRFSLLTDGHFILFSMVIEYRSGAYKMIVKNEISRAGRAIVTVSLDRPHAAAILRTDLLELWQGDYKFDFPVATPSQSLRVIIKCDITWLGFVDSCNVLRTPHIPEEVCLQRIPYTNELNPDVILIIGDEKLPAHKNVLALHSPVFLGMFDAPMKESKENRVVIEDVDFSTMETLLKIIYSGKTGDLDDGMVALKVLAVAEKYQMLTIKTACEYKLQLKVGRSNVFELLNEGDKYNAAELLKLCMEYIIAARNIITPDKLKKMCLNSPNLSAAVIATQMEKLCSIPSSTIRTT